MKVSKRIQDVWHGQQLPLTKLGDLIPENVNEARFLFGLMSSEAKTFANTQDNDFLRNAILAQAKHFTAASNVPSPEEMLTHFDSAWQALNWDGSEHIGITDYLAQFRK